MSTITNKIFNLLRNETHPAQYELSEIVMILVEQKYLTRFFWKLTLPR